MHPAYFNDISIVISWALGFLYEYYTGERNDRLRKEMVKMKRWMALLLAAALSLSLTACGDGENGGTQEGQYNDKNGELHQQQDDKNKTGVEYTAIDSDEVVLNMRSGDLKVKVLGYEVLESDEYIEFFIKMNISNQTSNTFDEYAFGSTAWQLFRNGVEVKFGGGISQQDMATYKPNTPEIKPNASTDNVVQHWITQKNDSIDHSGEYEVDYYGIEIAKFNIDA